MMKSPVVVVVGPTAVGKSAFGIELAKRFSGQIISGDSQQVYQGLDIGTAKILPEEQKGIPHHLLNIRELEQNFSAHDFVQESKKAIAKIFDAKQVPIIVGGTGLYLQSLIEGYHLGGEGYHKEMLIFREELSNLTDQELFKKVEKSELEIKEINRRRATRALELAKFGQGQNQPPELNFQLIGLNLPRAILYQRINERVEEMFQKGLVAEAKLLYENYPMVQATKAIGYKELFPYFAGEISLNEAKEMIKKKSRHYAKRQITWFKNRMQAPFYDPTKSSEKERAIMIVEKFLSGAH